LYEQIYPDNATTSLLPEIPKRCRGPSYLRLGDLNHNSDVRLVGFSLCLAPTAPTKLNCINLLKDTAGTPVTITELRDSCQPIYCSRH